MSDQPAGTSTATTVPGEVGSAQKDLGSDVATPQRGIKRSNTSVSSKSKATCPKKLKNKIKSKEILKEARMSPADTWYYSPSPPREESHEPEPAPKRKATAVKAKAQPGTKPRAGKKAKTAGEAPTPVLKAETPSKGTAAAVQDALTRAGTAELQTPPPTDPSQKSKKKTKKDKKGKKDKKDQQDQEDQEDQKQKDQKDKTAKKPPAAQPKKARKAATSADSESSDSSGEEDEADSQDGELTLEQVRAKKAAHARYMRFSRSLKSKRRAQPA